MDLQGENSGGRSIQIRQSWPSQGLPQSAERVLFRALPAQFFLAHIQHVNNIDTQPEAA